MGRASAATAIAAGLATLALAAAVHAQDKQVYRYVDPTGRVVYTDRPPPPDAKNTQTKRVGANYIENNELPIASQQAAERFPVTLYTFTCGELCDSALALLNKRGVPYSTVDVQSPDGAKRLQSLTGEMNAPVLAVGDKLIAKGYNEARWQALLDEAGYPKTPPPRRAQTTRAPQDAPPPAASSEARASAVPPADGGYPKN
jgi:glutaredoxin